MATIQLPWYPPDNRSRRQGTWLPVEFRRATIRAGVVYAVFALLMAADAVLAFVRFEDLQLVDRVRAGIDVTLAEAEALDRAAETWSMFSLVLTVATAIVFLAWLSRSVDNAPMLGAGIPERSPREAIGWWFVPFASLILPLQIVRDLWARLELPQHRGRGALVIAWWIAFLVSNYMGTYLARMALNDDGTLDGFEAYARTMLFSNLFEIVAAGLAIWVVFELQSRANARARALGYVGGVPAGVGWRPPDVPSWGPASGSPTPGVSPSAGATVAEGAACLVCGHVPALSDTFCDRCGSRLAPDPGSDLAARA